MLFWFNSKSGLWPFCILHLIFWNPNWLTWKPVLNVSKTKLMMFTNGSKVSDPPTSILSLEGNQIKLVTHCKYLGILIYDHLTFIPTLRASSKSWKFSWASSGTSYVSPLLQGKKLVAATFSPCAWLQWWWCCICMPLYIVYNLLILCTMVLWGLLQAAKLPPNKVLP